jgi:hypothetical protein
MVNRLLFWLSGVLILGVIVILLFRPGNVSDITIAVLLLAAIGAFVVYRRDKGEGE